MKKINLLCLIDDDSIYRYTVQKTVENHSLAQKVLTFGDGEEAIIFFTKMVDSEQVADLPDVVFLDLNMPMMDGWDFLEEFKLLKPRIDKTIWVYIVSSSVTDEDINRAKAMSEVRDYLVKPVKTTQFKSILKQWHG